MDTIVQQFMAYAGDFERTLADTCDPSVASDFTAWQRTTGVAVDPSYT